MARWRRGIRRPTRRLGEFRRVDEKTFTDAVWRREVGLDDAWKKRDAELKGQ
jgi:hypothetical protein